MTYLPLDFISEIVCSLKAEAFIVRIFPLNFTLIVTEAYEIQNLNKV